MGSSRLMIQNIALKEKTWKTNGKCNNISSAGENK
jgi:hypothetical protein